MNILIVDDDKYLVEKIVEGIAWKEIGIDNVLSSNNIQQAKKIFELFPISILLADIEMPQGSGLELLEWVRENNYPTECIYLSSYAHFAYAQKALSLHSKGYLLKPISNKELTIVIANIVKQIDEGEKKSNSIQEKEEQIFWKKIIESKSFKNTAIIKAACNTDIYHEDEKFCLEIIRILFSNKVKEQKDITLFDFVIRNVSKEFYEERQLQLEALERWSEYEWILIFKDQEQLSAIKEYALELRKCLSEILQLDTCIYIGQQCCFLELDESRDILEKMRRELVSDDTGVFLSMDYQMRQVVYHAPPLDVWEKELYLSEHLQEIKEKIMEYLKKMVANNETTVKIFEQLRNDLTQMIYHYLNQKELLASQIFDGTEFDAYSNQATISLKGMGDFIEFLFSQLEGYQKTNHEKETVIEQLKRYIYENLENDISRNTMAKTVFLSEDYVSKIFAGETGMSIPNYIAKKRMEKASDYLSHTNLSVSQIALKVGYSNFSYFSKTFKNYAGITPNEYRNKNKNL